MLPTSNFLFWQAQRNCTLKNHTQFNQSDQWRTLIACRTAGRQHRHSVIDKSPVVFHSCSMPDTTHALPWWIVVSLPFLLWQSDESDEQHVSDLHLIVVFFVPALQSMRIAAVSACTIVFPSRLLLNLNFYP
jgi:hypothetical protein